MGALLQTCHLLFWKDTYIRCVIPAKDGIALRKPGDPSLPQFDSPGPGQPPPDPRKITMFDVNFMDPTHLQTIRINIYSTEGPIDALMYEYGDVYERKQLLRRQLKEQKPILEASIEKSVKELEFLLDEIDAEEYISDKIDEPPNNDMSLITDIMITGEDNKLQRFVEEHNDLWSSSHPPPKKKKISAQNILKRLLIGQQDNFSIGAGGLQSTEESLRDPKETTMWDLEQGIILKLQDVGRDQWYIINFYDKLLSLWRERGVLHYISL